MKETLYATFKVLGMAEEAVEALLEHGGNNKDISVITKEPGAKHSPAGLNAVNGIPAEESVMARNSIITATDAKSGAAKGAGIGLGVGIAAAITSLVIPGLGLLMGGGELAVAFAGAAGATVH